MRELTSVAPNVMSSVRLSTITTNLEQSVKKLKEEIAMRYGIALNNQLQALAGRHRGFIFESSYVMGCLSITIISKKSGKSVEVLVDNTLVFHNRKKWVSGNHYSTPVIREVMETVNYFGFIEEAHYEAATTRKLFD